MFSLSKISFMIFLGLSVFSIISLIIYRKFVGMETYTKILEKRIANLKKENTQLHKLVNSSDMSNVSFDEANIIMNKIFECDMQNIPDSTVICSNKVCCDTYDASDASDADDVTYVTDVPTIRNIIEGNLVGEVNVVNAVNAVNAVGVVNTVDDFPVAKHEDNVVDVESVISEETVSDVYNRRKLTKMNVDKLKEICMSIGISTDGTKVMLIDRILSQ